MMVSSNYCITEDINKLRTVLIKYCPVLYFMMNQVTVNVTSSIEVAAAYKNNIYVNIARFSNLQEYERLFALAHELMHILLKHSYRIQKVQDSLVPFYNTAADFIVNNILVGEYKFKYMEGAILSLPVSCSYKTNSVEEIANELKKKYDDGNDKVKQFIDMFQPDLETRNLMTNSSVVYKPFDGPDVLSETTIDKVIFQASKAVGNNDPLGQRLAELVSSKINWKQLLRNYITQGVQKNILSSYSRFNRRIQNLPGISRVNELTVWIFVDVSASISNDEYNQFISEVYRILQIHNLETTIVFWDTEVEHILHNPTLEELLNIKIKGYGGTDFGKAYKRVANQIKDRDIKILLSDFVFYGRDYQLLEEVSDYTWILVSTTNGVNNIETNSKIVVIERE